MNVKPEPSILMVCTANIIRSPMAAVLLKQRLERSFTFGRWTVDSAGVQGLTGQPADIKAELAVEIRGLDLSRHIARRVDRDLISEYDLVITVEHEQKEVLGFAFPEIAGQIVFIGELAGVDQDVADPLGRELENYFGTLKTLEELLDKSFFIILLLAKYFHLRRTGHEIFSRDERLFDIKTKFLEYADREPVVIGIEGSKNFPGEFRYQVLELLMKLYPQDEYLLDEMKQLAGSVPPSEEEHRLLKIIKLQAVVMPLTCLTTMGERPFWHPEVAAELDILRQTLNQPDYQELYIELEQLYRRNLPSYKYRLNIWDLTAKYVQMPHKVGDYEQAMVALKEESL